MINKDNGFDPNIRFRFPEVRRYAFIVIALFVFILIIYGNSFHAEWHYDDFPNIVENNNVHLKNLSWPDIKKTFYGVEKETPTRPFSYFSFALNYYLGGLTVFGYHAVNLAIHYIAAVFLFLLIFRTLQLPILKERYESNSYNIALLAAFIWVINPVQVLAVSIIVQRMTSMAGMFYVMSMYFYLKGRTVSEGKPLGNITYFILCALSAILSFGTKENAAMLPITLFFYDLFLIQGLAKENLRRNMKILIIPVLILVGIGFLYIGIKGFSSLGDFSSIRQWSLTERLLTQPRVILFYLSLLFYPVNSRLMLLHDIEFSTSFVHPWTTLAAILFVMVIIGYALFTAKKRPLISFCILFFFLNHIIEGSIFNLELIYEHRNYIPSMFIFVPLAILIVNVLDTFSFKKSIQFTFVFVIALLMMAMGHTVYMRNNILKYEKTLWLDNAAKTPNLSGPYLSLAKVFGNEGNESLAFLANSKALQLRRYVNLSEECFANMNNGIYFSRQKNYDNALIFYKNAVDHCPYMAEAYNGLAMVMTMKGEFVSAVNNIKKAVNLRPHNANYHNNLSFVFLKCDRYDEAISEATKSLDLGYGETSPFSIIAEAFRKKGEFQKSIQNWNKVLSKSPQEIEGIFASIELYSILGEDVLLERSVKQLLDLKGKLSFSDIIVQNRNDAEMKVYVPDARILLPIIKRVLVAQTREIGKTITTE